MVGLVCDYLWHLIVTNPAKNNGDFLHKNSKIKMPRPIYFRLLIQAKQEKGFCGLLIHMMRQNTANFVHRENFSEENVFPPQIFT